MKKSILLMVVVMMALTSCRFHVNGIDIIDASDNIVEKEYKLDKFNEVATHVVANVKLVQSETKDGHVILSAPDNYIDLFSFESEGEKLDIRFIRNNVNIHTEHVTITVYTSDLLKIKNTGAAEITLDSLDTDNLEVTNTGVGSFRLNKVLADNVCVKCNGVGSISIDGETKDADLSCSGVGSINAEELRSNNVKARVTGVGSISCYASESIDGKVTGIGGLKYAGHPKKKDLNKPTLGGISEI
jgi:hypothetical protein